MYRTRTDGTALAALTMAFLSGPVVAQSDNDTGKSAGDIAKELANPNTALAALNFPVDYVHYDGDALGGGSESAYKISFQPSFPYPLGNSTNFFLRPLIPIYIDQPVPVVGGEPIVEGPAVRANPGFEGTGTQLGDIGFDAAIGKNFANGIVLVGGVVGSLPTATDDRVGLDQYLLGPEMLLGRGFNWGFAGLLLTHQWDVAGEDSFDTSVTGGQYFYTINLKNAWQIQAQPTFTYNHEAESGERLTLPVGIGLSKTVVLGKTPWKFGLQYWHYVERPDSFGPKYQIRFQFAPVVPLPW